ncbi:hypothetical protein [Zymomonas mobilis]|nr:hypothetical protein [Zymomonas mobilis]MDX5948115.1 hypothetical protein [Zymomonas mobilis subsp. pomaceae]
MSYKPWHWQRFGRSQSKTCLSSLINVFRESRSTGYREMALVVSGAEETSPRPVQAFSSVHAQSTTLVLERQRCSIANHGEHSSDWKPKC